MGWLVQNDMLRHITPVDYFIKHFSNENETRRSTVIAAAAVRGTVYAAVRHEMKTTGKTYVFRAVIPFKNNARQGFGYNAMHEAMGPCEVDCPDRIMRLLSPVEDIPDPSFTADWRASVAAQKTRQRATRKQSAALAAGDVIRLRHAVSFRRLGITTDSFLFIGLHKRTPIFEPTAHPGLRCRLTATLLADATVER
jgi:hypothetical protein